LQDVNIEMVACYWQIRRLIVEEEQRGEAWTVFRMGLIKEFCRRLIEEFGRGFHHRILWFMRNFYLAPPKVNTLRSELSWTHYQQLLRVENRELAFSSEAKAVNIR